MCVLFVGESPNRQLKALGLIQQTFFVQQPQCPFFAPGAVVLPSGDQPGISSFLRSKVLYGHQVTLQVPPGNA